MKLQHLKLVTLLSLLALSLSACTTLSAPDKLLLDLPSHSGPDEALTRYDKVYRLASRHGRDTSQIRLEIEKLSDQYPNSVDVLERNAEIAFENNQNFKASQFLDRLYQLDPTLPKAAILRSRIALSDGNRALSKTILNRQLKLTPDHAGLYEALAGTLYFEKKYTEAKDALKKAFQLGAPRQRINYHMGLISEALDQPNEAMKYYQEALKGDEIFEAARPRLAALQAHNV